MSFSEHKNFYKINFGVTLPQDTASYQQVTPGSQGRSRIQRRLQTQGRFRRSVTFYSSEHTANYVDFLFHTFLLKIAGSPLVNFDIYIDRLKEEIKNNLENKRFETIVSFHDAMKRTDKVMAEYTQLAFNQIKDKFKVTDKNDAFYLMTTDNEYLFDFTNNQILHNITLKPHSYGDRVGLYRLLDYLDKEKKRCKIEKKQLINHFNYIKIGKKCLDFNTLTVKQGNIKYNGSPFILFQINTETGQIKNIRRDDNAEKNIKIATLIDDTYCSKVPEKLKTDGYQLLTGIKNILDKSQIDDDY